jgi:NitT/TauT family transport system substrate-binding protein
MSEGKETPLSSVTVSRRRFVGMVAAGAVATMLPATTRIANAAPAQAPAYQDGGPTTIPHAASVTWWGHVPLMVAVEKGFFTDAGLQVELVPIVSSADRMLAVASGSVMWSNTGSFAAIGEMAKGNETFYWFANVDDSPGNQGVVAQPGISSFADLRGKKVAVTPNADAEMMLHEFMDANGLTEQDLEIVPMKANEMTAAFTNKNIDAVSIWEPVFTDVQKAVPGAVVLGKDTDSPTVKQFGTQMAPDMVIIRRDLADNYPQTTSNLLTAFFRGVDLVIGDPQEAARTVMEKYFKKSFDDTLAGIKSFNYFPAATQAERTQKLLGTLTSVVDWQFRKGRIPAAPNPADWLRDLTPVG